MMEEIGQSDLRTLKKLCESFEYGSNLDRMPYTFTLQTGYIIGRRYEFLEEGFFEYNIVKVSIIFYFIWIRFWIMNVLIM
jgi:hypothetical protein